MGISTIQSYNGAQIFEAVGLEKGLIDRHFAGTASRIGGIGLDVLARETLDRHARAYPRASEDLLPVGGIYAWRRDGEKHMWNPETIALDPARGPARIPGQVRRVRRDGQRPGHARRDAARAAALPQRRRRADPDRRGRAVDRDRQALRHRRDVAGLDLDRGARDARDRDEPPAGPVEHRRGRGGPAPLRARRQRRSPPQRDQAGRVRALRRDDPLPAQRRPAADQDGPGRQARRGRPAARATRSTSTSAGCATRPRAWA